jgi:hypothetical protein
MSDIFFEELGGLYEPDHVLGVGSGTHAEQAARVMGRLEALVKNEPPDLMIVPGDVNSTLAASLAAAKTCVLFAHIESGLRSFDRTMPEEFNRLVMHFVGNTMIDTLVALDRFRSLEAARARGLLPGSYLLVTLHRPNLVDGPLLNAAIERLAQVAEQMPGGLPGPPSRPRGTRLAARLGDRADRLPRVPCIGGRCRCRAHRLGRHPGRDHLSRGSVLHAAREHRAAGHDPGANQQLLGLDPGPDCGDPRPARCAQRPVPPAADLGRQGCGAGRGGRDRGLTVGVTPCE